MGRIYQGEANRHSSRISSTWMNAVGIALIRCHFEQEMTKIQSSDLDWFHGKG